MRKIKNPSLSSYFPVKNGEGLKVFWNWEKNKFPLVKLYSRSGKDRMLEYLAFVEEESVGYKFTGETAYTDVQRWVEDTYSQWFDL